MIDTIYTGNATVDYTCLVVCAVAMLVSAGFFAAMAVAVIRAVESADRSKPRGWDQYDI